MDFWLVRDGKIVENRVSVDFAHVMAQLGKDVFDGKGWEVFDRSERAPPRPQGWPRGQVAEQTVLPQPQWAPWPPRLLRRSGRQG